MLNLEDFDKLYQSYHLNLVLPLNLLYLVDQVDQVVREGQYFLVNRLDLDHLVGQLDQDLLEDQYHQLYQLVQLYPLDLVLLVVQ
jgi:hypothetical protein